MESKFPAMRTYEEQLAYGRGRAAGIRFASKWPEHRPPIPQDEFIGPLMKSHRELRDQVDSWLATLCPDDEWAEQMGRIIDTVDEASERASKWLKDFFNQECENGIQTVTENSAPTRAT